MNSPDNKIILRVLDEVATQLQKLGGANDAEDRNFMKCAHEMRIEACSILCTLFENHPFLDEFLPEFRNEMRTNHIYWVGWSNLLDDIEKYRTVLNENLPR